MKIKGENFKVLIAVPAHNEEHRIPRLLELLEPWKKDVIVVDDGSIDRTASLVLDSGFNCFSRKTNLGLAGFYATAKVYASRKKYTHLIAIDADGQHDTGYISEFVKELQHYDLVSGNRFHDISGIAESKVASNLFAILLFKKFLNITLPDVACGFRGMELSVIETSKSVSRFGIIYDMLIQHSLCGKLTGFVRIPAIYHANDPLNTDISEIKGLISAIYKYHPAPELNSISE
jgi:glycosyltransferase involved in cell wall biosynthesis